MRRAVFLDRDNTIIHNDGDLGDPEQVRLIDGAARAIASIRELGYYIAVVTNQGGVAGVKERYRDTEPTLDDMRRHGAELTDAALRLELDDSGQALKELQRDAHSLLEQLVSVDETE